MLVNILIHDIRISMSNKQFILGVGCQKGGTTWLHNQLSQNRHVDMGFRKEYHVFDALHVKEFAWFMNQRLSKGEMLRHARRTGSVITQIRPLLKSANFRKYPANYFKYFEALTRRKHITTVGDITPGYCALPVEVLSLIKSELEQSGFAVKVVFLMRDPVDRCWSAIRMKRRKSPELGQGASEQQQLREMFRAPAFQIRTQYENTVRNLDAVFEPDSIFYEFYERLFTPEAISRLKNFLNIPELNLDIGTRVNVSPKINGEISDDLRREICEFYWETYEFCFGRFGAEELWTHKPHQV
jgi:hypothetical protein